MEKVSNYDEFLNAIKALADKNGFIWNITSTDNIELWKYLKANGAIKMVVMSGRDKYRIDGSRLNEMLENSGMYYADKSADSKDMQLKILLDRYGAIKDGKFDYYKIYSYIDDSGNTIEKSEQIIRKSLADKIHYCSKNRGMDIINYLEKVFGEIYFGDRGYPVKREKYRQLRNEQKLEETKDYIKNLDEDELKDINRQKVNYRFKKADATNGDNVTPMVDYLLREGRSDFNYMLKTNRDVCYNNLIISILTTFPGKVIANVRSTPEKLEVYSNMRSYYENFKNYPHESLSEFWNDVIEKEPRLAGYKYRVIGISQKVVDKRNKSIRTQLDVTPYYMDKDGHKHISGIFKNRKLYNPLRREALSRNMKIEDYLQDKYGIVLDSARRELEPNLNTTTIERHKANKEGKDVL